MNYEERLLKIADGYRAKGYQVVVRPGAESLPPFAKGFDVEIVARRPDGNVLASVKGNQSQMQADSKLPVYAEAIEGQPGWRYDLFVVGPEPEGRWEQPDVQEQSEERILRSLDEAERLLEVTFVSQAFIAAWGLLQSAMRHRLRADRREAGWGISPRTMLNELVSSGILSNGEFRDLEGLFQLRSILVHGFSAPDVEPNKVQFLVGTARRLLEESRLASQTA